MGNMKKQNQDRAGKVLAHLDHTLLDPTATKDEVAEACTIAAHNRAASVCIPPCYVKTAAETMAGIAGIPFTTAICTVIGFPNGYSSTQIKVVEAAQAVMDGAGEVDMVINLGMVRDWDYAGISAEIQAVRTAVDEAVSSREHGYGSNIILKVIVETGAINCIQVEKLCTVCALAGADYIKTSTGFGGYMGATEGIVRLMAEATKKANETFGTSLKIKASGGIRTVADAILMIEAGADRIGASKVIRNLKEIEYVDFLEEFGLLNQPPCEMGDYVFNTCIDFDTYAKIEQKRAHNAMAKCGCNPIICICKKDADETPIASISLGRSPICKGLKVVDIIVEKALATDELHAVSNAITEFVVDNGYVIEPVAGSRIPLLTLDGIGILSPQDQ